MTEGGGAVLTGCGVCGGGEALPLVLRGGHADPVLGARV